MTEYGLRRMHDLARKNYLLAQVDQDRQRFVLFDEVIDHITNGTDIKE